MPIFDSYLVSKSLRLSYLSVWLSKFIRLCFSWRELECNVAYDDKKCTTFSKFVVCMVSLNRQNNTSRFSSAMYATHMIRLMHASILHYHNPSLLLITFALILSSAIIFSNSAMISLGTTTVLVLLASTMMSCRSYLTYNEYTKL